LRKKINRETIENRKSKKTQKECTYQNNRDKEKIGRAN